MVSIEESHAFAEVFTLQPVKPGALSNLKFAVKNNIEVRGKVAAFGHPDWKRTHPPAASNAVCIDQLLAEGALFVGKTLTDTLALGLEGENAFFGDPLNPKAPDRYTGGSSSGTASAVACEVVDFAVGSDGLGSMRIPASHCGIFGIRISPALVSMAGVITNTPSYDTMGVCASKLEVLIKATNVLIGKASENPFKMTPGSFFFIQEAFELMEESYKESYKAALEEVQKKFPGNCKTISIRDIDRENATSGLQGWADLVEQLEMAEGWSSFGGWFEATQPEMRDTLKARIDLVRSIDRANLQELIKKRYAYMRSLRAMLGSNNFFCLPTAPGPAPLKSEPKNGIHHTLYFQHLAALTSIASVGHLPQLHIPLKAFDKTPMGFSLISPWGTEELLFNVAQLLSSS